MSEIDEAEQFAAAYAGTEPPKPAVAETPAQPESAAPQETEPQATTTVAEPATVQTETPEFDFDTLPDAAKAAVQRLREEREEAAKKLEEAARIQRKLELDHRAMQERVAPSQRRVAELERELEARSRQPAPQVTAAPVQQATDDDFLGSAEFKAYERDFPDEAKVLRKSHEAVRAREARLEQQYAALAAKLDSDIAPRLEAADHVRQHLYVQEQVNALTKMHPDWQEIRESEHYASWVESQPEFIRQTIKTSSDATEVGKLISYYKFERDAQAQATTAAANNQAATVQAARQARVATSVAPAVGASTQAARVTPMDETDIFAAVYGTR